MKSSVKNSPTIAGLFVGCGGLDYGFKCAGFNIVWANEMDQDAAKSYEQLIGHPVKVGDARDFIKDIPPSVDILVGGPPCQSFSLVGKRLDEDPRGELVFTFFKAIKEIRPQIFVMENVPGLMSSKYEGIRLPYYLAEQFRKLGYKVQIEKLNATDFLVPQRRRRVLMIGRMNGLPPFISLNYKELLKHLEISSLEVPVTVSESLDDLPSPGPKFKFEKRPYKLPPHSSYSELMRRFTNGGVTFQALPTMSELDREFVRHIPPGGNYTNIPDNISTTRIKKFKKTGGRTTTYGRLHPDFPSYTINTYFNRPNVGANYHHREERLITVREAMRLQSFPDHFEPVYKNQRSLHMQVGNAVPPLMAQGVAYSVSRMIGY